MTERDGRECLEACLRMFRGLGDASGVEACLRALTLLGEATARRRRQLSEPDGLTTREDDVARLVAAGFSNPEIAAALGIRTGTARRHVANILAKRGFRSRA